MSRIFRRIWSVVTTLIVIAVLIFALLLAGGRLIGLRTFAVLSGSMEPLYHTGSLIYVKKTDPFSLKTGDVITYMLDEDTLVTHRIAGIVPDEEDPSVIRFRTKGDANEAEDGTLVHYKNVVGCPVFTIPALGYIAEYIQHPPGIYMTIAAGALLMLLMFLPELAAAIAGGEQENSKRKKPKTREETRSSRPAVPAPARRAHEVPAGNHEKPPAKREKRGGTHVKGRHEA